MIYNSEGGDYVFPKRELIHSPIMLGHNLNLIKGPIVPMINSACLCQANTPLCRPCGVAEVQQTGRILACP